MADLDANAPGPGEGEGEPQAPDPAVEARAKRMGWVSEEEYRGDPANWRDAEAFVERGENELPILRERNRDLDRRLEQSDKTARELKDTLAEFRGHYTKVEQRAFDRAMSEIEAKQRTAVEESDIQAFDEAARQAANLKKEATAAARPEEANGADSQTPPTDSAFAPWHAQNPWYETDVEMTVYAEQVARVVGRRHPQGGAAMYTEIGDEVKKKFPDRFGNRRREDPPDVEGGRVEPPRRPGGRTYADLPAEAKVACDRFCSEEVGPDGEKLMTREEYVKDYDWEG